MGTPEFALPSLKTLIDMDLTVVGVFTQPDRPSGRGHKLESPPVKRLAQEHGIPVFQFERIRKQEGLDALRALKPDLVVTAAFGQILSKKILEVPRLGTINVHASLLPRHRGAAPINWSIILGEKITGVTTMLTDVGLDTGDILLKTEVDILPEGTAGELTERLAIIGGELLKTTVERYCAGELIPQKQDEALMTYDPMMDKALGEIDWNKDAQTICNLVRGTNPWPGAYALLGEEKLKLWRTSLSDAEPSADIPVGGLFGDPKHGLFLRCTDGTLQILELQAPGGKKLDGKTFLRGKNIIGSVLS